MCELGLCRNEANPDCLGEWAWSLEQGSMSPARGEKATWLMLPVWL